MAVVAVSTLASGHVDDGTSWTVSPDMLYVQAPDRVPVAVILSLYGKPVAAMHCGDSGVITLRLPLAFLEELVAALPKIRAGLQDEIGWHHQSMEPK